MSKSTTVIIVLAAILLLSLCINYYQHRVSVLLTEHYAQGHTLDSLQLSVYTTNINALVARTDQLQTAYIEMKNRYTAAKVQSTPTDGLSDDALAKILKEKLIPQGGP